MARIIPLSVAVAILTIAGCGPLPAGGNGNPGPIPPHIQHSPVPNRLDPNRLEPIPVKSGGSKAKGKPIVINNNKGGNVLEAIQRREKLAASGRPVEIRGYCRSACTIYISLPNACLARDATVGFHAPRIPNTQIVPPIVDQLMAQYYRGGILEKWQSEWRYSLKMTKLSAKQYKKLDPQVRYCKK